VESATGIADPPLTDTGREQARRLAEWLKDERLDHIVVSPLRRARETAAPLAEQFGLEPEVIAALAEFDAEASSYIPMAELRATRDPRLRAMTEGRWEELGSMVEPEAFRADVIRGAGRGGGGPSGPTSRGRSGHGAVINVYLGDVIGTPRLLWFEPRYASVSRVLISRDGVRSVESVNESTR